MIYCLLCVTTMFKVITKSRVNSALTFYYMIDVIFSNLGTCGDGSGVKTTYGPCRGLKFVLPPCVTAVPGNLIPLVASMPYTYANTQMKIKVTFK